ncbi:hypothetical protein J1N35_041067 [Gossypium stocksii]|uniref:Uncharacterized protein n=1 Tax=Gossypium stocksii TaxID=47602 RepID=A0A9D3UFA9_9ROSI|nr:hypothetical protein J1N35_041067 [Gossypium stocksii]
MAPLSKKTIQHFTYFHPLTKVSANTEFLCDSCSTLGFGTRCGICCINLYLECVLVPCEEETTMLVPRFLKTLALPPLASSTSFDAYYAYGFGVIPPPPYFTYAYGVPYAHGYRALSSCGEFYKVNSYQTHSNGSQVQGNFGKVKILERRMNFAVSFTKISTFKVDVLIGLGKVDAFSGVFISAAKNATIYSVVTKSLDLGAFLTNAAKDQDFYAFPQTPLKIRTFSGAFEKSAGKSLHL